jgi:hypothetical protein
MPLTPEVTTFVDDVQKVINLHIGKPRGVLMLDLLAATSGLARVLYQAQIEDSTEAQMRIRGRGISVAAIAATIAIFSGGSERR